MADVKSSRDYVAVLRHADDDVWHDPDGNWGRTLCGLSLVTWQSAPSFSDDPEVDWPNTRPCKRCDR